jgi:malic enzyme
MPQIVHFSQAVKVTPKVGAELLHDTILNKGTAFTERERDRLALRGLLPATVETIEQQAARCYEQFSALPEPINKYTYLRDLLSKNTTLFYKVLIEHISEMAPIIYTPTVGKACQEFSDLHLHEQGVFITPEDKGHMEAIFQNIDHDVDVIVVTDGSRILGLGDLAANGMGIPVGKLSLYVSAGGIDASRVLPITVDFGTDNQKLLADPNYIGYRHPRLHGEEYYELIDEFIKAAVSRWPDVMVQWEDFALPKARHILEKYRDDYLSFNDDIQGTGSITAATVLAGVRAQGRGVEGIKDTKLIILGGGSAGIGIADQIVDAAVKYGADINEARKNIYILDRDGLLGPGIPMREEQERYSKLDVPAGSNLLEVVKAVKPHGMIGVCGVPGLFSEEVLKALAEGCERPMVFPLSNPTSCSETTHELAIEHTNGQCVFASGSPFPDMEHNGAMHWASQCNNAFIFPGLGLGIIACGATVIPDALFTAAATAVAEFNTPEEIAAGKLLPRMADLRAVSRQVAIATIKEAQALGIAKDMSDAEALVDAAVWQPEYAEVVSTYGGKLQC